MRFNQTEYAEYYHKQMVEWGYPGKLLPFVVKELEGYSTVLDIGSGTGLFSIPLARAGHFITAVEPSPEMINIMNKNIPPDTLSSIRACRTEWENWEGEFHDAAISIHSLYPMPDIKKAVTRMNVAAAGKIIIVRDSDKMRTLSGIVRGELGIISNRDLNAEIAAILDELAVNWRVVNIREERKHPVMDIQHEADSILYQLKLDERFRDEIFSIINREIDCASEIKIFNAIYSDNAYIFTQIE